MFPPLRILILENSLADTELMLYELRSSGLQFDWQRVETESDYLACLDVGWDVILSDFNMPQFEAMRALQLLQERSLDIPFIIVTGSISEEVAVECMKLGVADYLLKDRLVRLGQAALQAVHQKQLRDEKRQAEEALQASEERFRRLADNAPDIIYRYQVTPTHCGFEYISPAVTAIIGYTPTEHYADPQLWLQLVHEDDRRVLQQWVSGEGLTQPTVLRFIHKDGAIVWTEHRNVAIYDRISNSIAIEGIARDITQRKQAEVALLQQTQREQLMAEIAQRIHQSLDLEEILNTTVEEVRQFLQADRAIVYRFQPDWSGVVAMESVATGWMSILNRVIDDSCFQDSYISQYPQGRISAIEDIYMAGLNECYINLLAQFQVRANLVVPILQGEQLWGLLIAHQCSEPRLWKSLEISLLNQLATQAAIAIQQAQLFDQVQQQARREQLLNHITQALNSSLDPDHILQEIANLTGESFGVARVNIFSINAEQIRVLNEWRASDQVVSVLDWNFSLSEYLDLLDSSSDLSFYRVFHVPHQAEVPLTPIRQNWIQQAQVLSELFVPIVIRNQLFGGLSLQTTTTYRTFTPEEIHLLERIADQAAIALYNAQSYEHLEQLVKERTQELEAEKLISEAANRAKSEFLTNMSHELRTPLTSILGLSSVLLEQISGQLNEKQLQYITAISSSGMHLLNLINDLLDLSKIEAGKEELILETILVEEVCQACLSLIQERAYKRGLKLSINIATEVTTCVADKRRLKQILFNLLSNAIKFTETGSVTLKVEQTEDTIAFSVIDTGIGISQAALALLFQPFQQLDSGLNRKHEGSGLGLALSRKLAHLQGGEITVTSELGRGSCFTLHLPKHPPGNIFSQGI